jgi:hypothetical protein
MNKVQILLGARTRLVACAIVGVLLTVVPTSLLIGLPSFCLFKSLFGVECLGCGMVRAMSCLMHGDIGGAAQFNPRVFALVPLVCMVVVRDVVHLAKRRGIFT